VLAAQPWDNIFLRLTAYAQKLLKQLIWRGEQHGPVPGGREATDFASEAILAVYCGRRQWNPEKYPDLILYLLYVAKSLVSNAVMKVENQTEIRQPDDETAAPLDPDETVVLDFLGYLQEEPELQRVVYCMIDGYTERAGIADKLGMTPSEVTNIRKKLARRLTAFQSVQAGRS